MFLTTALLGTALALPPSSELVGEAGSLTWTVAAAEDAVELRGVSPAWTVVHRARPDLTPVRTERTAADGATTVITYEADGTRVRVADHEIHHQRTDLWDGDTLDVRLGHVFASGWSDQSFDAIDSGTGKLYSFNARKVDETRCGAVACTEIDVQLAGVLRWVGPTWKYWFAADGQLMRFEGPIGSFAARGGAK